MHHGKLDHVHGWNKCVCLFFFPFLFFSFFTGLQCCCVFSQATSDFCVSPDKFIVEQTKDVLTAGDLLSLSLSLRRTSTSSSLAGAVLISPGLSCPPFPSDVAHYYLFCSPNLPNPFQQVMRKERRKKKHQKEDICPTHLRRTMENVLYWKMSFPSSAIGGRNIIRPPNWKLSQLDCFS